MGDAHVGGREGERLAEHALVLGAHGTVADGSGAGRRGGGAPRGMGDASRLGGETGLPGSQSGEEGNAGKPLHRGDQGFWDDFDLLDGADGRIRRIESGVTPLATGVPARVGRLRAYGNAICVPLAAEFVTASLEAIRG